MEVPYPIKMLVLKIYLRLHDLPDAAPATSLAQGY